ncbi:MAG: response regulator [Planctomycetota bacterium]|nr:response regulator [Planctomycetota bacterium]
MEQNVNILMIEDSPADTVYLENLLREASSGASFELTPCRTLSEGLETIVRRSPDLILLDLHLPDANGLETVVAVQEKAPAVPIIVLTGENDSALAIEAIRHGAQDYLGKSELQPELLDRAIRYAIGRNRFQEEIQQARQEVLRISERERMRIGQELHDGLGQKLAAIAFLCKALDRRLGRLGLDEQTRAEELVTLVTETIDEAQDLSRGLYPVMLERSGLLPALQELALQTETLFSIPCRFKSSLADLELPSDTALHLYRIAQEAINNSVKHSGAESIILSVKLENGILEIAIHDNGCGPPDKEAAREGMGLQIMRYRANLLHAELQISGGPEQGTCVLVRFTVGESLSRSSLHQETA